MTITADSTDRYIKMYAHTDPDWDRSISRQADALDRFIKARWPEAKSVLDVSCGIGTQAIGLAMKGFSVVASDPSESKLEEAKKAAAQRSVSVDFSLADMRQAHAHHRADFDLVVSLNNSIQGLLSDGDIELALQQIYLATRPGGACLISARDYEKEGLTKRHIKSFGLIDRDGAILIYWQVWDFKPPHCEVSIYFTEDVGLDTCQTHVTRTVYNAITPGRILDLMQQAGFADTQRIDNTYFQPLLVGIRPNQPGGETDDPGTGNL